MLFILFFPFLFCLLQNLTPEQKEHFDKLGQDMIEAKDKGMCLLYYRRRNYTFYYITSITLTGILYRNCNLFGSSVGIMLPKAPGSMISQSGKVLIHIEWNSTSNLQPAEFPFLQLHESICSRDQVCTHYLKCNQIDCVESWEIEDIFIGFSVSHMLFCQCLIA